MVLTMGPGPARAPASLLVRGIAENRAYDESADAVAYSLYIMNAHA